MTEAYPKIPAELLRRAIKGIRDNIIDYGGEVRFNSTLTGINVQNGAVKSIVTKSPIAGGVRTERCDRLILACGQNSSDIYEMLLDAGVLMSPRPYFAGIRIEHPRVDVDESIYGYLGGSDKKNLQPALYTMLSKIDGREVFTYRVMGGGTVMPAQTSSYNCIVEGAMPDKTLSPVTTSAICVSVPPSDYGGTDSNPLAGVEFRRHIEQNARQSAKYGGNPANTLKGFFEGTVSDRDLPSFSTYPFRLAADNFTSIFPPFMISAIKKGIYDFSKRLVVFNNDGAILTAPETRIIPPVKILRDENYAASGIENVYICGECAGFTEGIINSAVEGIKSAVAAVSDTDAVIPKVL
jgi:uncharacterized FAD-dependent dehydrogenase